jgi:hypothetical protein
MVAGEMNFAPTSWVEAFEGQGKESVSLADVTLRMGQHVCRGVIHRARAARQRRK